MERKFELIAPCHFGLEAVLKKEVTDLGYEISLVEDGKVTFWGDEAAICRANVFLRTAERVLIKVGSFPATTFEELFQGTKALPWEEFIPEDGKFWVAKATSIKSKLFSPSDIQSIMKKAMVERLKEKYGITWFAESGNSYPLRVFIHKDIVTVGLDTTGVSLHKRGYRTLTSKAPITETLASALILLTPWRKDRILITNPPYGERIEEEKNLPELYRQLGERFAALDSWSAYVITAYGDTEKYMGRKADKNRKIYNGMMKTYFYQFLGPKPPKRKQGE